jgi:hypothetical protein
MIGRSALLVISVLLCSVAIGAAQSHDGDRSDDTVTETQRALANARFVAGDTRGALDALNAIGEPRIDEIKIEGRLRARQNVLADYLGGQTGEMLTWGRLTRIGRRLQDLPIASTGKVRYDLGDGSAIVRPILFEKSRFYEGAVDWVPVGVRALISREAVVSASDVTGHGDVWTPSVRWASGQPRVAFNVTAPAPGWLPGVVRFDTLWQRQQFAWLQSGRTNNPIVESRTRAGAALSDWLTGWLRWEGGAAIDRIESTTYLSLNGNLNVRLFDDHMAAILGGSWYTGARETATGNFVVAVRSTTRDDRFVLLGRGGVAAAGDTAPLSLWPTAGSGYDQLAPLRAHPLVQSGIVANEVFGRQMAFVSAEGTYPVPTRMGPTFLGIVGFVDAARAWSGLGPPSSPLHVDIGTGIRLNTSRSGGRVRLDAAYGLRDGKVHVSAGYVQPWGRR